jgi:hypothetical protein
MPLKPQFLVVVMRAETMSIQSMILVMPLLKMLGLKKWRSRSPQHYQNQQ